MDIVDTVGSFLFGSISAVTPTALLVALGLFVLALACASIGWMLRGADNSAALADKSAAHQRLPALPDLRESGRTQEGKSLADNSSIDATQVLEHAELAGGIPQPENRVPSFLNSTLATTAQGLQALSPANRKTLAEAENRTRELEVDLRSTNYKLETKEAELREFRTRSTEELRKAKQKIKDLDTLQANHKGTQAQLAKLTEQNKQLERDHEATKEKLSAKSLDEKNRNNEFESRKKQQKIELDQLKSSFATLQAQNDDLEKANEELGAHNKSLETSRLEDVETIDELNELRKTAQATHEKDADELQSSIERLSTENQAVQQQLSSSRQTSSHLETELGKSQKHAESVQTELNHNKEQTKQRESEQAALIEKWQTTAADAQKNLDQALEQVELRNRERDVSAQDIQTLKQNLSEQLEKQAAAAEKSAQEKANLNLRIKALEKFEHTCHSQSSDIKKLQQQIVDSSEQHRQLDEQLNKQQTELVQSKAENESLSVKIGQHDNTIVQLNKQKDSALKDSSALREEVQTLRKAQQALQTSQDKSRKEVQAYQLDLKNLRVDLDSSKAQTEAEKTNAADLDKALNREIEASKESANKLSAITQQLSQRDHDLSKVQSDFSAQSDKLKSIEYRNSHLENKTAGLIAEVERGKSDKESLNREKSELQQQISSSNSKQDVLETSNNKLENDNQQLRHQLAESKKEADLQLEAEQTLRAESAQLNLQITEAKQQLTDSEDLQHKTREELVGARQKITTLTTDGQSQSRQISQLKSTVDTLEAKLQDREAIKNKLASSESELLLKNRQNDSFRKQIEESRHTHRNQQEKVSGLELELAAFQEKHRLTTDEIKGFKQTIASMQVTHSDALNKETSRISQLLDAAQSASRLANNENKQLQSKLHGQRLEIESNEKHHQQELQSAVSAAEKRLEDTLGKKHRQALQTSLDSAVTEERRKVSEEKKLAFENERVAIEAKHLKQMQLADDLAKKSEATILRLEATQRETRQKYDSDARRLNTELSAAQDKLQRNTEELKVARGSIEKEKAQSKASDEQISLKQQQLDKATEKVAALQQSQAQLKGQLQTQQTQSTKQREELKLLAQERDSVSAEKKRIDDQLQLNLRARSEDNKKINQLEQQLVTTRQAEQERESAGRTLQELVDSLKTSLKESSQSLQTADANLIKRDKSLADIQVKFNASSERAKELDTRVVNLQRTLLEREKSIQTLEREHEQFVSLKGLVADRQADIEALRGQINKLATLESALQEKNKKLTTANTELANASKAVQLQKRKIDTLEKSLAEANSQLSKNIRAQQQPVAEANEAHPVEANRLQAQVQSLLVERDLGLERVKELSEVAKSVSEKNKIIRDLRADLNDQKINDRELDSLRSKLDRQEADLRNKKLTIEELKKKLPRSAANSGASANGSAAAKTDPVRAPIPDRAGDKTYKSAKVTTARTAGSAKRDEHDVDEKSEGGTAVAERSTTTRKERVSTQSARPVTAKQEKIFDAPAERDNLKRINGIGPVMEKTLNTLGVTSFRQIAEFTKDDVERVSSALDAFPGRIERDGWIDSAKKEYIEKYKSRS